MSCSIVVIVDYRAKQSLCVKKKLKKSCPATAMEADITRGSGDNVNDQIALLISINIKLFKQTSCLWLVSLSRLSLFFGVSSLSKYMLYSLSSFSLKLLRFGI